MVEWISGFIVPLVKVTFMLGIFGFIVFIVLKAFHNGWTKQFKFVFKYKIFKKKYPEKTVQWCINCMDNGIGYYEVKKLLMVNSYSQEKLNETLWIYDELLAQMHKSNHKNEKGGVKNGREFKGHNRENKITEELPTI